MKQYLEIGKIVAVQGLRGEVRVEPWCDSAEFLCGFDRLYFDRGKTAVEVQKSRPQKTIAILKIAGVDTVEQAQELRNKVLYMDRNDVELDEGCYFVQDLIGLTVVDDDDGTEYGKLCEVSFTGANDVYHIKGADGRERLIPAIPDVVRNTDITNGIMRIHVLDGLFDD